MPFDPASIFVAVLIASVGLWWFNTVLTSVRKMEPVTRYGIYALIWLAYFILVLLVIRQTGG